MGVGIGLAYSRPLVQYPRTPGIRPRTKRGACSRVAPPPAVEADNAGLDKLNVDVTSARHR